MSQEINYKCTFAHRVGDLVILKETGKLHEIEALYPVFDRMKMRYEKGGAIVDIIERMNPYYVLKNDDSNSAYSERSLKLPSKKLLNRLAKELAEAKREGIKYAQSDIENEILE